MRVIYIVITLCLLISSSILAETINVLTNSKSSSIYINNQLMGNGELLNHSLNAGSYLITVKENDVTIFSEIVEVEKEKVKTLNINVTSQLSKQIVSLEEKKQYATYTLDKEKGKLGLGAYINSTGLSGLKASYDLNQKITLQPIFWMNTSNSQSNYTIGGKVINYFNSQYTKHTLARLYTGVGLVYGEINSVNKTNIEIPFGLEFKLRSDTIRTKLPSYSVLAFGYFAWLYNLAVSIDGMYYFVETGLTYNQDSNDDYYAGVKLAVGFQYYF